MNIVGKRFWFFLLSGVLLLIGIVSLAVFGLKPGIEFSSGSLLTVSFNQTVNQDELGRELAGLGYADALIQKTEMKDGGAVQQGYLIHLPELSTEAKGNLQAELTTRFGTMTVGEFDSVSPLVAAETTRNAVIAIAAAAAGILLYLTWAFRKMPSPIHYGTCAVIALLHDIVLAMGIFSVLGAVLGWQINLMFVTGILAILGYSVNNIVIIFDRIRENLLQGRSLDFETVVNNSVVETMGRSMNTNLTTIFPVIALLLIVGASIQNLLVVLLAGVVVGTYDSICVAPALLVVWHKGEWGRFIGRRA